jgi:hypothetical protein
MYQIVMNDGRVESFDHPAVSTVTGDVRQVWQLAGEGETMAGAFPTAEIAATVDCQHTESDCPCLRAVRERLHPPAVEPQVRAARKLAGYHAPRTGEQ